MIAMKADPGIGRESAPVGSRPWAERVRLHMQSLVASVRTQPEAIKFYVDLVQEHRAWTLMNRDDGTFFRTFEEFCEYRQPWGLGRSWPELKPFIEAACGPVVVAAATASVAPTHADASKAQPRDDKGKVRAKPVGDDDNERSRGTSSSYLAERIARDFPDVHARMLAGEYPSVRAAARDAGLVKDPDPVKVAERAIRKLTHVEKTRLLVWLRKELAS